MGLTRFPNGVSSFGVPQIGEGIPTTTGSYFFVHSGTGNSGNTGFDPSNPLATVQQAIDKCTASKGDIIVVMPGHTETVTATSLNLNVAGITVKCLGHGENAAFFTYTATGSTIDVTAANCRWIGGVHFGNVDQIVAAVTMGNAKSFTLQDARFEDSTAALHFLTIVTTSATDNEADDLTVTNNSWSALALAPNAFISILAAELRPVITYNRVDMAATNDVGHFLTIAAKVMTSAFVGYNWCNVIGATNASVGIFLTGSGTSTGFFVGNQCHSLDTTSQLFSTTGTGFRFNDNILGDTADKSGVVMPAVT